MSEPVDANSAAGRSSFIILGLCLLVAVCEGFDLQAAGVAGPRLGPAFKMTAGQLGWFFSSSTFGLMFGAALGGRLSDRFGRKPVLIASVAVFGLLSLATALAPDVEMLLLARFLTGVGLGGALPNLVALAAETTAPARRRSAIGLLYGGMPAGGALAGLVTVFGGAQDWRAVFYVGGAAPLLVAPLLVWALPAGRCDRGEIAASTSGFVEALVREGRGLRTLLLWLGFFLGLMTMYILLNWLPTLLVSRGLSRPEASLVQVSFNVMGALGGFLGGWAMDRAPLKWVVAGAFAAAVAALVVLAGAPVVLGTSIVVGGLVGLTVAATQAQLYALAAEPYPTRVRGTGVGSAVAVGRLGSAAGPLLGATLLGAGQSPQQVLAVLIPLILVSGLATLALVALLGRKSPPSRPAVNGLG